MKTIIINLLLCSLICNANPMKSMISLYQNINYCSNNKQHELPDGVIEIEYLESTGEQWIDTKVPCVKGLNITMLFTPIYPVSTSYQDYFGGSNYDNIQGYRIRNRESYENRIAVAAGGNANHDLQIDGGMTLVEINQYSIYVNGNTSLRQVGQMYHDDFSLYLFCFNKGGIPYRISKVRIYSLIIEGYIDLIPVKFINESGLAEGAMYDKVSHKLFKNAGSGRFIIGPDKEIE